MLGNMMFRACSFSFVTKARKKRSKFSKRIFNLIPWGLCSPMLYYILMNLKLLNKQGHDHRALKLISWQRVRFSTILVTGITSSSVPLSYYLVVMIIPLASVTLIGKWGLKFECKAWSSSPLLQTSSSPFSIVV